MGLSLTRRSFLKTAAVVRAAGAAAGAFQGAALAATAKGSSGESDIRRVRSCCRGCGKFECGVWVTIENGRAVKIEGDTSAPHSVGNCCNKSVASLQACYHPDRLKYPMKRTNPKGEDPGWVRISWDEALDTISKKIKEAQDSYGNDSLFTMCGTGRETCMQSCPGYAQLFMSINNIIGYQICKGPRHFSAALTSEWHHSWSETIARRSTFIIWASTPEVSNYDEAGRSIIDEYNHADYRISVDPRKTQLGNVADLHLALTPGTDGALTLSMCDVIIENDLIDDLYVKKWTNAPFLVLEGKEPSGPEAPHIFRGPNFVKTTLLTQADLQEDGDPYKYMVWDNVSNGLKWFCVRGDLAGADETYDPAAYPKCGAWEGEPTWTRYDGSGHALTEHWVRDHYKGSETHVDYRPGISQGYLPDPIPFENLDPALYGTFEVTLKGGTRAKVRPVFDIFAERCAEYAPEKAEKICGVPAKDIETAALKYGVRGPRGGQRRHHVSAGCRTCRQRADELPLH